MGGSNRDKAANRAGQYRKSIAEAQGRGDHRAAFYEAERWLLSEVARAAKQRPADAPQMYADVIAQITKLAEALPFYRPTRR